jgi:hypothetical protein
MISNIRNILVGLLIVTGFVKCQYSEIDYEIQIINEIFQELTEKMYVFKVFPPPPPPPPPILNRSDSTVGYDTMVYQTYLDNYKAQIEKLKADTQNIVLAINDSLFAYQDNNLEYIKRSLPSENYLEALNSIVNINKKSVSIDLIDFKNTGKYKLRFLSLFPKGFDIWKEDYDFVFGGVMHISRIYLNSNKDYGIFYCSFSCGGECGHGDIICIKRENNKWTIEKTIVIWIS